MGIGFETSSCSGCISRVDRGLGSMASGNWFPFVEKSLPFSSIRDVILFSESRSMMRIDYVALASAFAPRKMNEEAGRDSRKSRSHTFSAAIAIAPTFLSFGQRPSHIHRS